MKNSISFSIALSLLLIGCGNSKNDDNGADIPKNISMKIPKELKSNSISKAQKLEKSNNFGEDNIAYNQTKEHIFQVEDREEKIKVNIFFANEIMEDIKNECKNTLIDTTCNIEADKFSMKINDKVIEELKELEYKVLKISFEHLKDKSISFGEIEFTKYDSSKDYQYQLVMDVKSINKIFEIESVNAKQTINWSKSHNKVLSTYTEETDSIKSDFKIVYFQDKNKEKIVINNSRKDKEDEYMNNFYLNIKSDKDKSFEILIDNNSTVYVDGEVERFNFSSDGKIVVDSGGSLNFSGYFNNNKFKEEEKFDNSGNIISSIYCTDNLIICNENDKSTWIESDYHFNYSSSDNNSECSYDYYFNYDSNTKDYDYNYGYTYDNDCNKSKN